MELEAAIMIRIVVPFEYDAEALDVDSYLKENENGVMAVFNRDTLAMDSAHIEESRREAAKHAETEIMDTIKQAIGDKGEISEAVVEEVRER